VNGIQQKKVQPRITMITAVDSQGQIYVSLLQANTDTDIMMLFMKEFIITLD